jgi:hypothetical protein
MPPVPFFFAFHSHDSFFTPETVLFVDFPFPALVPRIPLTSLTVSSVHEPFGAADAAGAAVIARPAVAAANTTTRVKIFMGRGA